MKKITISLLTSTIITSCSGLGSFSTRMKSEDDRVPNINEEKLKRLLQELNKAFIEMLEDPEESEVFAVINAARHKIYDFINKWNSTEPESGKAFIEALKFVIYNSNRSLDLGFIKEIRSKLIKNEKNEFYAYIDKSNLSLQNNEKNDIFAYYIEFGIPNIHEFITKFCKSDLVISNIENYHILHNLAVDYKTTSCELETLIDRIVELDPILSQNLLGVLKEHMQQVNDDTINSKKYQHKISPLTIDFSEKLSFYNPEKFKTQIQSHYDLTDTPYCVIDGRKIRSNNLGIHIFNKIIQKYEENMSKHETMKDDEKYYEILMLVKSMEMCHFFRDFNIRTWYIVMLKEFIRFDLPVTMFDNPNWIDFLSVDFLIKLCKYGTKYIENLVNYGRIDNTWPENVGTYIYGTTPAPIIEEPKVPVSNIKIDTNTFDFSSVELKNDKIIKLNLSKSLQDKNIIINNSSVNKEEPIFIDFYGENIEKISLNEISYVDCF